MNFLSLCQQLRADCAIQGDGPAGVTNQTGMYAKLVTWVREAYTEIQNAPFEWTWMRETVRLPLLVGVSDYPLGGVWARPDIRSFEPMHAVLTRSDDTFVRIAPTDYDTFQTCYPVIGATPGTPTRLTILPTATVRFNLAPSEPFTLQAIARLAPQQLAANGDEPKMPAEFHSIIVHRAKMKYAMHDGDPSLFQGAKSDCDAQFRDLVRFAAPLIQYRAFPLVR